MASKIDFNTLLAKADKNTKKASKLLEEKKRETQQKTLTQNTQATKQSALAFIQQRKEEIRKRNEQEARELLAKKQQKDAINNKQQSVQQKKPPPSSGKSVSSDAVQKYLNSKKNTAANNSANAQSSVKKPNVPSKKPLYPRVVPAKQKATGPTAQIQTPHTSSRSYYDTVPETGLHHSSSSSSNNGKTKSATSKSIVKPPVANTSLRPSSMPVKPGLKNIPKKPVPSSSGGGQKAKLSYDQMLKIAENCHKEKASNPKGDKTEIGTSKHVDLYFSGGKKPNKIEPSIPASSRTDDALKKKGIDQSRPRSESSVPRTAPPIAKPVSVNQGGMSSWDRIMSDMKKKPVKKPKRIDLPQQVDYEESEEEEVDSEMEDFIDDGSDDEDTKVYSKTIQEIFKYDPKRYKNINEDDIDDMETNYHSQLKEEKMSLKLAIREDQEELKREEELEKQRLEKLKRKQVEATKESNIKKLKSNKS